MLKILLPITFVSIQICLFAQSAVYHPFPEDEAIWNTKDEHSFMGVCCEHRVWETSYIQTGDTTINGTDYNKIYRHQYIYDYNIFPSQCYCNYPITHEFFGGTRNDIAGKKVYFFDLTLNEEKILYDFDVQIGDTIHDYYNEFAFNIITSIDSILVDDSYRKRFNFAYDPQFFLDTSMIEGIGSLNGFFNTLFSFENHNELLCYQEMGTDNFVYPNALSSCGIVGLLEKEKEQLLVRISPNPTDNEFILDFTNEFQNGNLVITNSLGKIVQKVTKLNGKNHKINCANLTNGVYYLQFFNGKEFVKQEKLIISH